MAKKKDITRNPPSWLEKGIFALIIVLILGIAYPIFMKINQSTIEFYECYRLQEAVNNCVDIWLDGKLQELLDQGMDLETAKKQSFTPTRAEIEEIYGGSLPNCPHPKAGSTENLFKDINGFASCTRHIYSHDYDPDVDE